MFTYIIKLYLIILIKIVDVNTNLNDAVFWSGEGGYIISEIYAKKCDKITLEIQLYQTVIGKQILEIIKNYSYIESKIFWGILSKKFAKHSSGNVNVFISNNNLDSIWYNIEKPSLLSNKKIKSITIHNI